MASRSITTNISRPSGGSGTSIVYPGSGTISSIAAGALVVIGYRYEGGTAVTNTITDSAGGTYQKIETGDGPTVGVAWCYNHPGGSSVSITVSLTSSRSFLEGYGAVFSGTAGEGDPYDAVPASQYSDPSGGSISKSLTSTASGMIFASIGTYSSATYTPTSPAVWVAEPTPTYYAGSMRQTYTGSGTQTMALSSGSGGATRVVMVAFKDATSGTAPNLSSPTATGGTLTGSGTVSTDTGSGTLWWKVDASATATDPGSGSETGAGWTSQTVSATGTQTVSSFSTLTSGTKYAHCFHVASGGRSGVANSASFTVGSGVTFSGTVPAQSGITATSFSLDLSGYFSGNMTRTYAVQSGSLSGSGLTLNTSTGVISGTLATVAVYTVTIRATDTYSDTDDTNSFTITVSASGTAPTVSSNPSNLTVTAGATASFTAAASGSPTPSVQWQENTGSWTNISGATSATLALGTVGVPDNGRQFRAVFTNSSGTATTTSATLTVNAATGDGTLTSEPLRRNNGSLTGATTLSWLAVRNDTTGADLLVMTSVAVNSSSIFTTGANAAFAIGQTYALHWKESGGAHGQATAIAT